jgi:hypothetical protein
MAEPGSPAEVLVVGGGVAALETLMALHDLAGGRVRVTLVAPDRDFVYRPMAVAEPFGFGEAQRYPYLRAAEPGEGAAAAQPLWWPPTKIAGRLLAPYLYAQESDARPGPAPAGFADFEVALEPVDATPAGR